MTQSDKWKRPRRPPVKRYFEFKERVKILKIPIQKSSTSITFILPMPNSWSDKKKLEMEGAPHQQKPDLSNLLKSLEDCVYEDDSAIWHYGSLSKIWGTVGQIIIY
ncbi:MAG: RusA family crossover junction endodeoxyribonuclease [Candidatus Heimdallarchaeaceae archaeon]